MRNLVTLIIFILGAKSSWAISATEATQYADNSLKTLMTGFWDSSKSNFKGEGNYWFYAQTIDSAVLNHLRKKNSESELFLKNLIEAQVKRGLLQKNTVYYDDENWMALSLTRAYAATQNVQYLNYAKQLFADVQKAEVFNEQKQTQGVWWSSQHTGFATAINMGSVIAASTLYRFTKDAQYLNFALRIYNYWHTNMVDQNTYQVFDFKNADGSINKNILTYDQGLAVGAALALYKITQDKKYFEQSQKYASFVINKMTSHEVLTENICLNRVEDCKKNRDLAQFKGITIRYLVMLAQVDTQNTELNNLIETTINSLWNKARDPQTGYFAHEWDGSDYAHNTSYPEMNSAVLALNSFVRWFDKSFNFL